jgi:hypothetical protein
MPAPKEPLEDGLYSKFHSLLPWHFALHFRAPSCMRTLAFWVKENSSAVGKVLRHYRFTYCCAQSPLATLFRPRGTERVQYEGIPYSQRGGIHHNLVGIRNLCVERHAPGLAVNGTAAVLTRGLSTVTVAVKPRGWSLVRHKCYLTLIPLSQRRVAQSLSSMCYDLMREQFALHRQVPVLACGNPSATHLLGESSIGE